MNATVDRPAIKEQVRQDGGVIDLFRYDYEELTLDAIDIVSRELRRDGLVN